MASSNGKKYNLSILLNDADGFLFAGKALFEVKSQNAVAYLQTYVSPCVVNLSFACELYLKFLYAKENSGSIKAGHHLLSLFNNLSKTTQQKITTHYNLSNSILDLQQCLTIHDKAFEQWRYKFEVGTPAKESISFEGGSLYNLTVSLKNVCYENEEE